MVFICPHCWVEQELNVQAFSKNLDKASCTVCGDHFNPFENKVNVDRASVFRTRLNIEAATRGYRANILLRDEPGVSNTVPSPGVPDPVIDVANLYSEVRESCESFTTKDDIDDTVIADGQQLSD